MIGKWKSVKVIVFRIKLIRLSGTSLWMFDDSWRAWDYRVPCHRVFFLHSSIVLCLLPCHMPLFSHFTPWGSLLQVWNLWISLATPVFFIYISRLLVVIFETWLYSLRYFYDVIYVVSGSCICGSCYFHAIQSSPESVRLTFVIYLNLIWSSRAWKRL